MRPRTLLVVAGMVLGLAVAGCGGGSTPAAAPAESTPAATASGTSSEAPPPSTAETPAPEAGAAATTPGPNASRPAQPPRPPRPSGDTPGAPAGAASAEASGPWPLYVGISIHVEGWTEERTNPEVYARHRAAILQLAQDAHDAGAVLSFELNRTFVEGAATHGDDVVDRLLGLGQGVAIHADVGGQGTPTLAALRTQLVAQREALAALGVSATHVSGVCSRGPWVEAAIAAGFRSTNGAVKYCLTSLEAANVPAGVDLSMCTDPAACHDVLPVSDEQRLHPFYAADSGDFLRGEATSGLLMIVGQSGESLDCLAEGAAGAGCHAEAGDLPEVLADLEAYLALHDPARVGALTYSWSIGSLPPAGFAPALFEAIAPYAADGRVAWASLTEIAERAMEALE